MRPSRGAWIFLIVCATAACGLFLALRPPTPRAFDPSAWEASDHGPLRFAMSADLVQRIVAERWSRARVALETGEDPRDGGGFIGVGMRHRLNGPYYIRVQYDKDGRATHAAVYMS